MALAAVTQYFPGLDSLVLKLLPASTRKMQEDHFAYAAEKIHRRLERPESAEGDFMTVMLDPKNNPDFSKMSMPEIESTTALLLLGGSETTGTTICGILNCLVQNPHELRKLETEVRTIFEREEDITFSALQQLPFLNAVINEGLRICNPVSGGLLRIVPRGGATVCGHFLPEGVSNSDSRKPSISMQTNQSPISRPTSHATPSPWRSAHKTSTTVSDSCRTDISRTICAPANTQTTIATF